MTVIGQTLFAGLVWTTILLVLAVFAFVLHGVIEAGGIDLSTVETGD